MCEENKLNSYWHCWLNDSKSMFNVSNDWIFKVQKYCWKRRQQLTAYFLDVVMDCVTIKSLCERGEMCACHRDHHAVHKITA